MKIQLSDHFTYKKLFRFTLPCIIMMVFTSIYGVVDGFFVSNFAGEIDFTALNFIYPFIMILSAFGFMFGTGGSALVAKKLGEGNKEGANKTFSMFVTCTIITGLVITVLGLLTLRSVATLMGASGQMLQKSVEYGTVMIGGVTFFMLQCLFHSFCVTSGKPSLGLIFTLCAGFTNIILDALFVGVFKWGVSGAAWATIISQAVGGVTPLIYFLGKNNSLLQLTKFKWSKKDLFKGCGNGSSELLSNISMSLIGLLYNVQLLGYAGENGVAAYGVMMYVNFVFIAVFLGYSIGTAPIIGYNFGAENHAELKNVKNKSLILIGVGSAIAFVIAEIFGTPLASVFVGYQPELLSLTARGFSIFSFSFLFAGLAIFGSSFFTALNDGLVSAIISFLRTLVFQVAAILVLPLLLGVDGIWISVVVAELMAGVLTTIFIILKRKKYNY